VAHLIENGDEVSELPETLDIGDVAAYSEAVVAARPEAICHLAAQSSVARSWQDPAGTFAVNALGTLTLCNIAAGMLPMPRVLLISSAEVYGNVAREHMPVREDEPFAPATPYAASKAAAEIVGLQAWLGRRLEVVRARAFNHTGPGQPKGFVVPDLAAQVVSAAKGELDRITTGNIEVSRDFTDVRDVVRAYRLLLVRGEPGDVYNICRGEAYLVSDLLHRLMRIAGADVPVWVDPAKARPADVPVHVGDPAKIQALTGWRPEIPLDQTLSDVLARASG
jgi:GDP-4-dehydro-6-deoxy-D-mannose reductase